MSRVWINYTTFSRDIEWLRYSLESIAKYCSGFAGITIVVPTWDVDKFLQFERYSTPDCPVLIKNFLEYPKKGFVHHLAMKCYADVFSSNATHVLHMDPDCLFIKKTTPEDYFVNDLPVLVIEPYSVLQAQPKGSFEWNRGCWRGVTEMALKFDCTHETMCRHPAVHHSWLYRSMRDHIEDVHCTPFYDFVIKQKNTYPQGFGEFNTLGSYALKEHPDAYHFIDRGDMGEKADPETRVWQGWSYEGAHKSLDKIKKILE